MTQEKLRREIGVWGLSANLINIIVGAGIFVLPAIVAAGLGAASILAYLFCGVLILLIMLCFAEVGSKVTNSGGAYTYIEVAFGKYAGFLTAILFLSSCIAADAAVANALVGILASVSPFFGEEMVRIMFFLLVFGGLAFVNVLGVKQGIGLIKFITIAKLAPLVLLVVMGWGEVSLENLKWEFTPGIRSIGEMALILFFAFQGGESGLAVSGEVKNPSKTVPRGIFVGILGVLLLYMLIQVVSQGVLGAELVTNPEAPLAQVAYQIIGPWGFTIMTIGAAVSMFGNLSGEVLSMPRVLFGAARDKVIPSGWLSKIHSRYSTPHIAIVVYAAIGFTLAVLGGFRQLAIISGASILLVYLGVALSVIKLRMNNNGNVRRARFVIPGGYTVPVLSVAIIVWFLSNLDFNEKVGMLLFLATLTIIYYLMRFIKRSNK
ncbi:APC family permease [Alkalitalea saponilacus]|uniref:Amino acid transporter n=1 Tax=Alkalitalea saponilacus TaxID=889453 RepID=A0A1T5HKU7_9BACT|nr:APC family permease [Alkalitalea saponilacus]ASB47797.1 amino acid permease [Alkalitalea saponilacus]SKC21318.1 Amino acid transporter [Alkalitalea saponilacus]